MVTSSCLTCGYNGISIRVGGKVVTKLLMTIQNHMNELISND